MKNQGCLFSCRSTTDDLLAGRKREQTKNRNRRTQFCFSRAGRKEKKCSAVLPFAIFVESAEESADELLLERFKLERFSRVIPSVGQAIDEANSMIGYFVFRNSHSIDRVFHQHFTPH